jgi:AcrR family transcriptional regulator
MTPEKPIPRKRLKAEDRREEIIEKSIAYFAEHGFDANTRDLASSIGITQPLLFRHFPSKTALIEAVFEEIYARQRHHGWLELLRDRSKSVEQRLTDFCISYADKTYTYEWIRLYMFAGLLNGDLNRRYIRRVTEPAFRALCAELRVEIGVGAASEEDVTPEEIDVLWLLHGGLYYFAIRKHIYHAGGESNLPALIRISVKQAIRSLIELIKP